MFDLIPQLSALSIIPIISIKSAKQAVPLADTLIQNGLPCAEITFRTNAAALSIRLIREAYPNMIIGAGTVLNCQQVDIAIQAGSSFIVSPGFNPKTVRYCQNRDIPIIPGVNNPSLVEQAMEMNLNTLKFFPAQSSGGIAMLRAMQAVYPVKFMPTGGVGPDNFRDYLELDNVFACGGTWMVPDQLVNNAQWDELGQLIREVSTIIC